MIKGEGMKTLNEICQKDSRYVKVIQELSVVKNAVELLGGRRRDEQCGINGDKEDEDDGQESKGRKEETGRMVWSELRVKEKIGLLELLSGLVKRGVEMEDEEELKEVGMKLEEEGNKHLEDGKGEEEKKKEGEEEKREWEELSEKAHTFVWMMEKIKARREGKKSQTLRMMKKMEEKEGKLEADNGRLEEEVNALKAEIGRLKKYEEGESITKGTFRVNTVSEVKVLSQMRMLFGDYSVLKAENNSIVHNYTPSYSSGFLGDKLNNSVHRMFESFVILFC